MFSLTVSYVQWHYTKAIRDLILNEKNFIFFLYDFFSIRLLTHTFFAPWKGLGERYANTSVTNITESLGVLALNMLMRLIGALIRFCVVVVGIVAIVFGVLLVIAVFFIWIFYPLIIVLLFFDGFYLIIK